MKKLKLSLPFPPFSRKLSFHSSSPPFSRKLSFHSSSPPKPIPNFSTANDPSTLATALSFSSSRWSLTLGSQTHSRIIKLGFINNLFTHNNLILMYSRCDALQHALNLFDEMGQRNLVSWTLMISGMIRNGQHDMGLGLFVEMMRYGLLPNEFTLASVLSACAALKGVQIGCSIHSIAVQIGLESNPFAGSSLMYMYASCRDVDAAENVFECIGNKDLACWNAMVETYALSGYGYHAMKCMSLMHSKGLIPDQFTYISALKGCSCGDLRFGRQIHALMVHCEFEFTNTIMNALADMYFRTGRKDYAVEVFRRTQRKDIVSWNTVISGYAQDEDTTMAVAFFSEMLSLGLKPNQVTFSVIFRLCGVKGDNVLGLQFYSLAYHLGFVENALVVNSLINMLTKCCEVDRAFLLFNSLPTRNIITWNEMIAGYTLNGDCFKALLHFSRLIESGFKSDEFTYSNVLGACHGMQYQYIGEQIHANIIKTGFDSYCSISSSLMTAYASFGSIGNSFKIFQDTKVRDLVCWGSMISAFSKKGYNCEALSLLNCLRETGKEPDEFILSSALNACANAAVLLQCKCVHSHVIRSGYKHYSSVGSAVIDAYAKCGDITSAKQAFDNSADCDAVLFNTLITAYAHHGLITEAVEAFGSLKAAKLCPTHATFVAVISACSHLGLVEQGLKFFDSISSLYGLYPSRDNFACLVDLLARNGLLENAIDVIEGMPYEPWPAIWRSALNGCRIHENNDIGKLAAERILKLMPVSGGAYVSSNEYAEG